MDSNTSDNHTETYDVSHGENLATHDNDTENSAVLSKENLIANDNASSEVSATAENISNLSFSDILLENPERKDGDEAPTVDITPEKSNGVLKKIVKEGEGDEYPGYGDKVSVHYTGWLLNKEPTVFDTSRKGAEFEFNLGRGMVIKGWDLGISTMKKGEIALFICHPKYAYGDMGYPPAIPAFTPLLFEVELLGWKMEDLSPKRDNSILRKILEKGEGAVLPNEGCHMKVKLIKFDEHGIIESEVVKEFTLGEGCSAEIPEGIEIALLKFRLNEKALIYLNNKYASPVNGNMQPSKTSDAEIKYEITLLDFQKVKDIWEMNSDEKFERAKLAKEKGISFFQAGNYRVAVKQFKQIVACLEKEPGVPPESQDSRTALLLSGYLNIALCCLKLGNFIDTVKICDKALAIDSKNEKALFRRGLAKMEINDCEEALQDFEDVSRMNPDNKAAINSITLCKEKIKSQKSKDKSTYNRMFEIFKKQDEERLKNMKTETGVWENGKEKPEECLDDTEDLMSLNSTASALLDANVIEISNNTNECLSYN